LSKYPLERLLDLQQQKESIRQLELARAERKRQEHESSLSALQETLIQELDTPLHPEFVECRARFTMASHRHICSKREHLQVQTEACHQARALLLTASMEKKKFEVHKEAHEEEAKVREQRGEQAALDEVGGAAVYRRQVGASR